MTTYTINDTQSDVMTLHLNMSSAHVEDENMSHGDEIDTEEAHYVTIESLRPGDFVKTYKRGYKKIKYIGKGYIKNDPDKWYKCLYKLPKTGDMVDDLLVTGGHSILVDEDRHPHPHPCTGKVGRVEDKLLLLAGSPNSDFIKQEDTDMHEIYHITLESDNDEEVFGIYANGVLAETCSEKCLLSARVTLIPS